LSITFIQTADAFRYADMAEITSKSVRAYAERRGYAYELFLGLKYGKHPWHAAFNRVFMLEDMIRRGVTGWVCYMDADAWIEDQAFDLDTYLEQHNDQSAIFASSLATDNWWDVNSGALFVNLSNEIGVRFAQEWHDRCLEAWPRIADVADFPFGGPDDQSILHEILAASDDYKATMWIESPDLFNSAWAQFIRQHLRSNSTDMSSRIAHIRGEVSRVLSGGEVMADEAGVASALDVVSGLYEGILGRPADGGLQNPYVSTVARQGVRDGIAMVANFMINSDEFRTRYRG